MTEGIICKHCGGEYVWNCDCGKSGERVERNRYYQELEEKLDKMTARCKAAEKYISFAGEDELFEDNKYWNHWQKLKKEMKTNED